MAGGDLEYGDQRRLPTRQHPAAIAIRDLPTGDHRRADLVAVETDRRGARRDAGRLADRPPGLPGIGSGFLVSWVRGVVPGVFALPAGIGDVITGLLALPVAYYLASRNGEAARSAIAWNIFGLLDFTIAVGIGLAIAPGPLQLLVSSIPNAVAGLYPTVLIPAFAVPSSILLQHALAAPAAPHHVTTSC